MLVQGVYSILLLNRLIFSVAKVLPFHLLRSFHLLHPLTQNLNRRRLHLDSFALFRSGKGQSRSKDFLLLGQPRYSRPVGAVSYDLPNDNLLKFRLPRRPANATHGPVKAYKHVLHFPLETL